jgi:alkanesulfonate monooxygenase SsuD/methylene tetrahydromethanopterin reductase-like flavin-dependent oxidoreductase (luciferase family)
MLTFAETLDSASESAMYGTPEAIAEKLSKLRAAGVEHVLLNGPAGSRENLRAFAREVMPAFSGPARDRASSRAPALANS